MRKRINSIVILIVLFFSVVIGLVVHRQTLLNLQNETDYVLTLKQQIETLQQSFLSDWATTNNNRQNNDSSSVKNSAPDNSQTIYTTFYQLHTVATNKIKTCNTLQSTASGYALLSGNVPALAFGFENESALLTYEKKKSGEKRLFDLTVTGNKIIEGLDALYIHSIHYLNGNGATYKTTQGVTQCSQYHYEQQSGWNATDIFLLPGSTQSDKVTAQEIVWFGYNEHDQEYTVKLKLNPITDSNFEGLLRMCTPNLESVSVTTMEMNYKTDCCGSFITIFYHVTLELNITYANLKMYGKIDLFMSEDFTNINTSPVVIKNPFA